MLCFVTKTLRKQILPDQFNSQISNNWEFLQNKGIFVIVLTIKITEITLEVL